MFAHFRNIEAMKQRLKELWKEGTHICSVPGPTGEQAKVRGHCYYVYKKMLIQCNYSEIVKDGLT